MVPPWFGVPPDLVLSPPVLDRGLDGQIGESLTLLNRWAGTYSLPLGG